jgi:hypothetical protein
MNRIRLWCALGALLAGTGSGCGSSAVPSPSPTRDSSPDNTKGFRLDAPIDFSLEKLLGKPRQELAELCDELTAKIRFQEKNHHAGQLPFNLLPGFSAARAIPVFREASYSARLQQSLPPYLDENRKDSAVALHLARFGDGEAALGIVEPSDAKSAARIRANRGKHNYPLEWTRLVGLHQYAAEIRLATGDEEGARQLVGIHKQLQEVLDAPTQAGLLGATLLPRGRLALTQAAVAWRQANKADLAQQAEAIVGAWGESPPAGSPLQPGAARADIERLLGSPSDGHIVAARSLVRAFDLFALPLPEQEVDAVIACFDANDEFVDVVVIYRPAITNTFAQPDQLAHLVKQQEKSGLDAPLTSRPGPRSYLVGDLAWEVTVVPHHTALGAFVRVASPKPLKDPPALPRQFGVVDFDRSFDNNRVQLDINQRGPRITVQGKKTPVRVGSLVKGLEFHEATLEGDPVRDIVNRFTLAFAADSRGFPALGQMTLPIWAAAGPGRLQETAGKDGKTLALIWEDARTRYSLRLPYGRESLTEFEVADRTPAQERARRAAAVAATEIALRQKRFQEEKLILRVERVWEKIRLGMTAAEVGEALPEGKGIVRRELPDGLGVIYNLVPDENPGYIPRELFVRFGSNKRVAEIRVRYTDAPGSRPGAGIARFLADIKAQCGAPLQLPSPWARVWADLPRREPAPVLYRWQDDATRLTCQRDSEGIEVAVLDCPLEFPDGVRLGDFRYLPVGPKGCGLGDKKADLLQRWNATRPEFNRQGALELTPAGDSPYDRFLVWFDKDQRAVQIITLHRRPWKGEPSEDQLAQAVKDAWADAITAYGWPRREDHTRRGRVQSWATHDDRTRVTVFWQRTKSGEAQLFTEWKSVPAQP